jgi:hypothetical protein
MPDMIGMACVGARMSPKQRLAIRQIDCAPLLSDLRNSFETARLPGRSPTAEPVDQHEIANGQAKQHAVRPVISPLRMI